MQRRDVIAVILVLIMVLLFLVCWAAFRYRQLLRKSLGDDADAES